MALTILRHAAQKPQSGATKLHSAHPLTIGLQACWLMNNGPANSAIDYAGQGKALALNAAPTWDAGYGGRFQFNGSTQYLSGTGSFALSNGPFTMSALIYLTAIPAAGAAQCIFAFGTTPGTTDNLVHLVVNPTAATSNQLKFGFFSDDTTVSYTWTTNTLIRISATLDSAKNRTLYANGASLGGAAATGFFSGGSAVNIGRRLDNVQFFAGYVIDAFLWNRALSTSEIRLHTEEPYSMFQTRYATWTVFGPPQMPPGRLSAGGSVLFDPTLLNY